MGNKIGKPKDSIGFLNQSRLALSTYERTVEDLWLKADRINSDILRDALRVTKPLHRAIDTIIRYLEESGKGDKQ